MTKQIKDLQQRLAECMKCDQFQLRRQIQQLKRNDSSAAAAKKIDTLAQKIEASITRRLQRLTLLPQPAFDNDLPVSTRKDEIIEAITQHQVVIICGETGSGKTTQLPKILLEMGRGVSGMIAHTQPRRLAARSVANRVAEELKSDLGRFVGYKVRFHDHVHDSCYIKLMTDGILLTEIQRDRFLEAYDTIIIDEAHERSINIDLLLGYLKTILPKRPDLKLIVTSATIDPQRFADFFQAPVMQVSGRTYPIELRYRPLMPSASDKVSDSDFAMLNAVDELLRLPAGDILVFLYGENEIRNVAKLLKTRHLENLEVLPLYSRQAHTDQNRIFQRGGKRRIILATNVAETSLTVPGIKYVIDTGMARISRYSYRSKVQRLPVEKISQASAQQRMGRCGRLEDGVCIRLYAEEDYLQRPEFTEAEILRANLASVILRMHLLKVGELDSFPFVEPPDSRFINDGYRLLQEIQALDENEKLTELGRRLSLFPLDPRIARMLVAAADSYHCLNEILIISSFLSVQDPRERPAEERNAADTEHAVFHDERSDFIGILNLWRWYAEQRKHLSKRKLRQVCQQHFLSFMRLQEWYEIHQQLHDISNQNKLPQNTTAAGFDMIHKAILCGHLGHVALKAEEAGYLGARGRVLSIHPGSALVSRSPKWITAAFVLETSRVWAACVAEIKPQWVVETAAHLIKYEYLEPYWDEAKGQVYGFRNASLYGLPLLNRERVYFGKVEPVLSREIFIRHGLMEGKIRIKPPFLLHNERILEKLHELENKARKRGLINDQKILFALYEQHLPKMVLSESALHKWLKNDSVAGDSLCLQEEEFLSALSGKEGFPDTLIWRKHELSLIYDFDPGKACDGISVKLPMALLNQLEADYFQWLVPGLLEEKVISLIKSLPKQLRRNFVPAPTFAQAVCERVKPYQEAFLPGIIAALKSMTGISIKSGDFRLELMPTHLYMNFILLDENNTEVDQGQDLKALQRKYGDVIAATFSTETDWAPEQDKYTSWSFDDLPEHLQIQRHGIEVTAYPAIVDELDRVGLKLFDTQDAAMSANRLGLIRLFQFETKDKLKYLKKNLPHIGETCLVLANVMACDNIKQQILQRVYEKTFLGEGTVIRKKADFQAKLLQHQPSLVENATSLCQLLRDICSSYQDVRGMLSTLENPGWQAARLDMEAQISRLIAPDFIQEHPLENLLGLPRYMKAITVRIEKLPQRYAKDVTAQAEINQLEKTREELELSEDLNQQQQHALIEVKWMIEELRVASFAQELKTPRPISAVRINKYLAKYKLL